MFNNNFCTHKRQILFSIWHLGHVKLNICIDFNPIRFHYRSFPADRRSWWNCVSGAPETPCYTTIHSSVGRRNSRRQSAKVCWWVDFGDLTDSSYLKTESINDSIHCSFHRESSKIVSANASRPAGLWEVRALLVGRMEYRFRPLLDHPLLFRFHQTHICGNARNFRTKMGFSPVDGSLSGKTKGWQQRFCGRTDTGTSGNRCRAFLHRRQLKRREVFASHNKPSVAGETGGACHQRGLHFSSFRMLHQRVANPIGVEMQRTPVIKQFVCEIWIYKTQQM